MNKGELISELARRTGLTGRKADEVITALIDIISNTLVSGEKIKLVGFGAFEPKESAPRTARDLRENKTIRIPSKRGVVFRVGTDLDKKLNPQKS